MSRKIVCTKQFPSNCSPKNAKIIAVGVLGLYSNIEMITVQRVVNLIKGGEKFYTEGSRSKKIALVETYYCGFCKENHIRSASDAVEDNNLDNLPLCNI